MSPATVIGYDDQLAEPLDLGRWVTLAEAVLAAEGVAAGELTLAFVTAADIADLHVEHLGEPGPTDVLSFPLDATDLASGAAGEPTVPVLLGDIVVCPEVAAQNAAAHAGTVDDELALLVVHGVLHVLGHDHADPAATTRMQARERALLEAHHWCGPAPATFGAHRSPA